MADERKVQPQVMYGSALQTRSAIRRCGYTGLDVLLTMYYDPMPDWQLLQLVQYNNGLARDHLGNQSCIELAAEILDDADRCPMKYSNAIVDLDRIRLHANYVCSEIVELQTLTATEHSGKRLYSIVWNLKMKRDHGDHGVWY